MNKKIHPFALIVAMLFGSFSLAQQQVDNPGFENWDNVGNNDEEPTEWSSNKTGSGHASTGPQTCFRESSIVHSGNYSAKIETGEINLGFFTIVVNGVMTNGEVNAPSTSPSDGFNETVSSDPQFHQVLTENPDSLVVWVNYTSAGGGDQGRVRATLHDNYDQRDPLANDPNTDQNVVATAGGNFGSTSGWERKAFAFDYASYSAYGNSPAYILINLTSSAVPGGGEDGSVMYADDIQLIYVRTEITPIATQNLIINQAGSQLTATDYDGTANSREWKYATNPGGPYSSFGTPETGTTYTPQFATGDTYYVVCESDFGNGLVKTSNEVQVNVLENSIAPTATQNIVENAAGTQLTVTETATASSREWKYSTTSGSGYQSFGTPETGTSYTPLFAAANTYYVVCESTNAGGTVTSNEVEVVVSPAVSPSVSIAPTSVQDILINEDGTMLTATEANGTATSREWKYSTTSGSGYQSFGTPETATTYTPNFGSAGSYFIICETDFGGSTETSNEVQVNVTIPTVSIAPTATQNIDENVAGTMLTATETPSAISREWKYSTTSGSGYQSFGTPETATTYTPLFASAGTYYVICESNFAGSNTIESNEVEIIVSAAPTNTVSISPTTDQQLTEGQNGTQLTATESPSAASSREWKYSTTSGSGYQSFSTAETATTYTPMFTTAGTYYVVCESDFSGSPVISNEVLIDVLPLGIEENGELNNITIYSYGNRVVIDASALTNNSYQFNIVTVSGQMVFSSSIKGGERKELTTDFAEGVYIIHVFNDNTQKQVKLFIK